MFTFKKKKKGEPLRFYPTARKRSGGPAHTLALPLTPIYLFIIYLFLKSQSVAECIYVRSPINTTSQHNFTLTKIERETEALKIHSENGLASFHARNTRQFSFTLCIFYLLYSTCNSYLS